jgi:hypothetical protein
VNGTGTGETPPRPLRPYTDHLHTFQRLHLEDSLLLAYTTGKKDPTMQMLASWIFKRTIQESVEFFITNPILSKMSLDEIITLNTSSVRWALPKNTQRDDLHKITVWARINLPYTLLEYYETLINYDAFTRKKTDIFAQRHLSIAQYYDSIDLSIEFSNINIDDTTAFGCGFENMNLADESASVLPEYISYGESNFPDDKSFTTITETKKIRLKKAPLEILSEIYNVNELCPTKMSARVRYGPIENTILELNKCVYNPLKDAVSDYRAYAAYCACLIIVNRCDEIIKTTQLEKYAEAAHLYKLCFLDLFYAVSTNNVLAVASDKHLLTCAYNTHETPWELHYPHDVRAFCGDDLPNLCYMLWHVPLWGEVDAPAIPLMKVLIKCMPFACQRRQLLDLIALLCAVEEGKRYCKNEGFWRIFSKIMWCCLAGTYPNSRGRITDVRKLLRIKAICENRTLLLKILTRSDASERAHTMFADDKPSLKIELEKIKKERENNCLIIFTAFRLYVLHMAHFNPHYAAVAHKCVDWPMFVQETNNMAEIIRKSNLFAEDAFGEARNNLATANKREKRDVYRFRKLSCAATLLSECNKVMEKVIYTSTIHFTEEVRQLSYVCNYGGESTQSALDMIRSFPVVFKYFETLTELDDIIKRAKEVLLLWQTKLAALESAVSVEAKEGLMNLLSRIPRDMRLKPIALSIMRLPEYGGIHIETVGILHELVTMYSSNALPKTIKARLDGINVRDMRIITWYFGVVNALERISFAPLDSGTIADIEYAMTHRRYPLFEGQQLDMSVYNVLYTICCEKVRTSLGRNFYGNNKVSFDLNKRLLICNRETDAKIEDMAANAIAAGIKPSKLDYLDERTRNKDMRLGYHKCPCNDQPVLSIPVKNTMLVIGAKAANKIRYTRCPRCACLHLFDPARYQDGSYCCEECARDDLTRPQSGSFTMVYQCAFCRVGGAHGHMANQTSRPRLRPDDILLIVDVPTASTPTEKYPLYEPYQMFQYLRFCHRCYKMAYKRYFYRTLPKSELWKKINSGIQEATKNSTRGIYK